MNCGRNHTTHASFCKAANSSSPIFRVCDETCGSIMMLGTQDINEQLFLLTLHDTWPFIDDMSW